MRAYKSIDFSFLSLQSIILAWRRRRTGIFHEAHCVGKVYLVEHSPHTYVCTQRNGKLEVTEWWWLLMVHGESKENKWNAIGHEAWSFTQKNSLFTVHTILQQYSHIPCSVIVIYYMELAPNFYYYFYFNCNNNNNKFIPNMTPQLYYSWITHTSAISLCNVCYSIMPMWKKYPLIFPPFNYNDTRAPLTRKIPYNMYWEQGKACCYSLSMG